MLVYPFYSEQSIIGLEITMCLSRVAAVKMPTLALA
jgi:hypothetical protein